MPTTHFSYYFDSPIFYQRLKENKVPVYKLGEETLTCIPVFLETRLVDLIYDIAEENKLTGYVKIYCQADEFSSSSYTVSFTDGVPQ